MILINISSLEYAHQISIFLGIKFMFDDRLVTVWSAPNYCYRCGNIAAILAFHTATNHETKLFNAVPNNERIIPSKTITPYFL